jgi:hypothetical protein
MMIIIFWEMTPCGSYKNRRFGGYKSLQLRSVTSSHSCTLKMEVIRSSETSVLIRATWCHFPEEALKLFVGKVSLFCMLYDFSH